MRVTMQSQAAAGPNQLKAANDNHSPSGPLSPSLRRKRWLMLAFVASVSLGIGHSSNRVEPWADNDNHPRSDHGAGADLETARDPYGSYRPMLDLIGEAEGTDRGDGYDETFAYGLLTAGDVTLTHLTLEEIDELQAGMLADPANAWNTSAIGRYQITQRKLRELRAEMNLSDRELFDAALQDRLAVRLLEKRGLARYLEDGNEDRMLEGWAKEWASLPCPSGLGHYSGRPTAIPVERVRRVLGDMRAAVKSSSAASPTEAASSLRDGTAAGLLAGPSQKLAVVTYDNSNAIRSGKVRDSLFEDIGLSVTAVYGPGYRAVIYSGGQPMQGTSERRKGTIRHDDGRAADVYVFSPRGAPVLGVELARLGQHWLAAKLGSVGLEMRGGGIHLDNWKSGDLGRGMGLFWNYASEGGSYSPAQAELIKKGMHGEPPHYAIEPKQLGSPAG